MAVKYIVAEDMHADMRAEMCLHLIDDGVDPPIKRRGQREQQMAIELPIKWLDSRPVMIVAIHSE